MSKNFKWGILGAGGIAKAFATGLKAIPDAELYAVGSRDAARAREYADKLGAKHAFGGYEELASSGVDAVYIATPHSFHCEQALLCLERGIPVLVEKPMAMNAAEERRMADAARANGVFLMEAMWTRFLPIMVRTRQLLAQGAIGEPRMLTADFSFRTDIQPQARLFNPELAGGALLDVGIYVMSFSGMVFGSKPEQVAGFAHIGETGVDEQTALMLKYPGGALSMLTCAIRTAGNHSAAIIGTEGRIEYDRFWNAQSMRLIRNNTVEEINLPFLANGFEYEAMEAMRCIREGKLESPVMTPADSIGLMESMDAARASWGLVYPKERAAK